MLSMIDNMTRTIEDSFLIRQPNPQLILSLSSEQQPNYQALLALNEDGLIRGANREARNLLNLETLIPEKIHIDDLLIGTNSLLNGEVHKGLIFLHKKIMNKVVCFVLFGTILVFQFLLFQKIIRNQNHRSILSNQRETNPSTTMLLIIFMVKTRYFKKLSTQLETQALRTI